MRRLCIAFGSMAAVALAVSPALGSTAKITIRGGGLTLANPLVARASTGLGAQVVHFRVIVPSPAPSGLSLSFSVSTQPSLGLSP